MARQCPIWKQAAGAGAEPTQARLERAEAKIAEYFLKRARLNSKKTEADGAVVMVN